MQDRVTRHARTGNRTESVTRLKVWHWTWSWMFHGSVQEVGHEVEEASHSSNPTLWMAVSGQGSTLEMYKRCCGRSWDEKVGGTFRHPRWSWAVCTPSQMVPDGSYVMLKNCARVWSLNVFVSDSTQFLPSQFGFELWYTLKIKSFSLVLCWDFRSMCVFTQHWVESWQKHRIIQRKIHG